MEKFVLGVDLGASFVKAGVVSQSGEVTNFKKERSSTPKGLLKFLNSLFQQNFARAIDGWEISGIGIGVPGPLDLKTGKIGNTPNLTSFRNCQIVKILKNEFSLPVYLERDTNVALVGEAFKGVAAGVKNAVMLTLGTGVGGAILADGKLYHGEHGVGAELGHLQLNSRGPTCSCGQKGHLEAYLGLAGVKRDYGLDHLTLIDEVEKGENRAIKVAEKLGEILGEGLVNIVNIFDPQILILAGGLAKLEDRLLVPAVKVLKTKVLAKPAKTQVEFSKLGDLGGVIGAAKLAFSYQLLVVKFEFQVLLEK